MYELGLLLALGFWLINAIAILVAVNSTFNRNLRKIGQQVSWLTFNPSAMDASDIKKTKASRIAKYLFIVLFNLPFTLLSWVYVIAIAAAFIYSQMKNIGKPQALREFAWKMRNMEMTFDQIVSELAKAEGLRPEDIAKAKGDLIESLRERNLPIPG